MPNTNNKSIINSLSGTSVYEPKFSVKLIAPKYWGLWLVALFFLFLSFFPWFVRSGLAYPLSWLALRTSKKRKNIAETNLKLCFKHLKQTEIDQLVKKHFFFKIRCFLDYGFLWFRSKRRISRLIKIKNIENYKQHYDAGTPVIFLSCHSLMLDFGAAGLTLNYPGVGLVKAARNELTDWLMQRARIRFNAVLYTRDDGIRPVARAIKQGVFFYYLPDEDIRGNESVFSSFFGVQALTLTTIGRLAKMCKAKIIPSITIYEPGKGCYTNTLFPELENLPSGSREQDAAIMNKEIEKLISMNVAQYMWTMKIFSRRPEGEDDVY